MYADNVDAAGAVNVFCFSKLSTNPLVYLIPSDVCPNCPTPSPSPLTIAKDGYW